MAQKHINPIQSREQVIRASESNFTELYNIITPSNYVDIASAQTITGVKTFSANIILNNNIALQGKNSGGTAQNLIKMNNTNKVVVGNGGTDVIADVSTSLLPNANNSKDLGNSSYKWRYLYLTSAIKDGTNTFSLPSASGTLALKSEIPTAVSQLTNDSNYVSTSDIDQIFDGTSANAQSGVAIQGALNPIVAVAQGKTASYVIQSQTDITGTKDANDEYTNVTAITGVTLADLQVGDIILIKDLNVPDYWVSQISPSVSLNKMETTKVDLTDYVTKNTTQTISATKTFSANQVLNNGVYIQAKDTNGVAKSILCVSNGNNVNINTDNVGATIVGGSGLKPFAALSGSYDLGDTTHLYRDVFFSGKLKSGNNATYGLTLPSTSGWTANKTIATTSDIPTNVSAFANDSGYLTSADLSSCVKSVNNSTPDANGNVNAGLIYVEGDTTATSPIWTASSSEITSYYTGLTIAFKIGVAGLSGTQTTLNINGLGAKKVFENVSTNPSTHYAVGSMLFMVYDTTLDSGNGAWRISADRTVADVYVRQYQFGSNAAGTSPKYPILTRYNLTNKNGTYDTAYTRYRTDVTIDTTTGNLDAPTISENGTALSSKYQSALVSGTNIKTINGNSVLGSGDLTIGGGSGTITEVQLNGTSVATSGVANVKALPNYNLSISTGAGNPREIRFVRVNYATFDGNNAAYFKIGAMCSHGNGSSYTFLEDIIIGVSSTPSVTCTVYKQVQNTSTYTVDGHTVYFGDVYWVVDTTNQCVDFYIIGGQYATLMFTPFTRIGNTVSDTSKIVQYTGSATLYSSGTRVWNTLGNGSLYAKTSDIPANSTSATGNTLVMRDANGDINGRYITGTWLKSTGATEIGNSWADVWVNDGNGWLYKRSKANFISDLGIPTYVAQTSSTANLKTLTGANGSYLLMPLSDAVRIYNDSTLVCYSSSPVVVYSYSTSSIVIPTGNGTWSYISMSQSKLNVNSVKVYKI